MNLTWMDEYYLRECIRKDEASRFIQGAKKSVKVTPTKQRTILI